VSAIIVAATVALTSNALAQSRSQVAAPDETCLKIKQVFFGVDEIAKRNRKEIPPFSPEYRAILSGYFDRGCPGPENFPVPKPGTDMSLANTAAGVVVSGGIKFMLGQPLLR
jgi:hypothetical protein